MTKKISTDNAYNDFYISKVSNSRIGLKPIYYTKNRKAKKGDILVSKTHIEICTGDGNNVYSCGSDDLDSVKNVKDNSTEPTSDLVEGETPIILRITETKKKKEK